VVTILVQLALAALIAGADPGHDTVFLRSGGQLRGVVIEEAPGMSVTIQLPGGEVRTLPAAEVERIEYQDRSARGGAAPPAEPTPPGQAPGWRRVTPEPSTFMLAAGVGAAFPVGDAAGGFAMSDLTSRQLLVAFELGFRFTPAWMASVVFEGGLGDAGSRSQDLCHAAGSSCDSFTASLGAQLRYTLTPLAPTTGWIAVGSAWEFSEVSSSSSSIEATPVKFSGWQALRLAAGWDLRNMHLYRSAFGVFGLVALGRYGSMEDAAGTHHLSSAPIHAWIQLGVRLVLGP
jgi:hypothetical protein